MSISAEKDGSSPTSSNRTSARSAPAQPARPSTAPAARGGAAAVLQLQRKAGNQAVAGLLGQRATRRDSAIAHAAPLSLQKAPPTGQQTPPPPPPSNAALQGQLTALELRTKALEGRQRATTQDLRWRGQFGDKMSSWKQAILRITGGLDAAQNGFTTAQGKQAEFDALVKQLLLAAATVGFAAGFEPLLSSQLLTTKIGATADEIAAEVKRVDAIVERYENPAVAAVASAPNIVGALPKPSTQPSSVGVAPGSSPVGYLAENLGLVEAQSQTIEQAFTTRATELEAMTDKDAATINIAPQEAKYQALFTTLNTAALGVKEMKDAPDVAKLLERRLWAAWIPKNASYGPPNKAGKQYPHISGFGSYTEDRFNELGISKLAGVDLSGHWYWFNSSGWVEGLLGWAKSYDEPLKK